MEHDFDTVLHSRAIEPPRAGFADRIIARAHAVPQWRAEALADYLLPKRMAAFAAMLVVGAAIGLSVPDPVGEEEFSMQTYLYDNGAVL